MNAFGKTLVVCNLLIGLCVPAFLLAVRSRQVNWKDYADTLKNQLDVARRNSEAKDPDIKLLNEEAKTQQANVNLIAKQQNDQKEKFKDDLEVERAKAKGYELNLTENMLNLTREQQESARLRLEIKAASEALEQYAKDKLELQEANNKYRKEAAIYRNEKDQWQEQAKSLAKNVRDYETRMREIATGGSAASPTSNIVKNPNEPNPPRVKVKGRILQVRADARDGAGVLVMLSVGTDQGVNKNHTLEVYRTEPAAEYLGRVRIIEVTERDSVGRLMARPGMNSPLRVNDIVVDNLSSP